MASQIHVVTASAGAGKTTRIVSDIADDVLQGGGRPPEAILATTFTIKAADELVQRTRARLFAAGTAQAAEAAARLLGARFGTVNAVCGQIVSEFAIELGRSPATQVIAPESEIHLLSAAAAEPIARHAPELNRLAEVFGHNEPRRPGVDGPDWRETVRKIITLARANGLEAAGLQASAGRSVQTFQPLLDAASAPAEALDQSLAEAVAAALDLAPTPISAKGQPTLVALRAAQARFRGGARPNWPDWVRLANATCAPTKDGRDYEARLLAVSTAAGRHTDHPGLHADCERFTRAIFDCAAEALTAYQAFKIERGLLDFTDQETQALQILENPDAAGRLAERVERVFVDEFQDSSPLQMAVFSRLAALVSASTWVGDPKQAIFGFRGADSDLTQAAFDGVLAEAVEPPQVLARSHRCRQGVIDFSNALFSQAFARMGLPPERHDFTGTTRSEVGFDQSPFGYWPLPGTAPVQAAALAAGIRRVLAEPEAWPVGMRDGDPRDLRVGDIAVLCRTNAEVARYAAAIARAGIAVAVERQGLVRTPHVELVLAAYRWVIDPSDRLALCEMARFFADDPTSDAWLQASAEAEPDAALEAIVPVALALRALREAVMLQTPSELIDAILALPALMARVERWGDHAIRLDDLEALRGCVRTYEDECASGGAPATAAGLLMALDETDPGRPRSLSSDAVQVMTYHTAKGLEWPLVVMTGLSKAPEARLFDPAVETDGALDWKAPLANRWIRFWPWPYGVQGGSGRLAVNAAGSALGRAAQARIEREDTRLLYVGVTRARDHLILTQAPKAGTAWLSVLDAPEDGPHVTLPPPDDNLIWAGRESFVCRVWELAAKEVDAGRARRSTFVRRAPAPDAFVAPLPLYLKPSAGGDGAWVVTERIELGGRLGLRGSPNMQHLGEALHGFLAADRIDRALEERLRMAGDILARWGVHELDPGQAVEASDRLHARLSMSWPGRPILREADISARLGAQALNGRIDLLVEASEGYVVIDHKSFPGAPDQWEPKAIAYGPQLGAYARALQAAAGECCGLYVHMPLVGQLIRLSQA